MKKLRPAARHAAFTLIELLVVIAIIAIIATFSVPAVTGILRGSAMTQASQMLTEQFSLARQLALSKNRAIEVRLYNYADPESPGESAATTSTWQYHALQLFEVVESGAAVPIDKPQLLPGIVVMSSRNTFSTLISGTGQTAKTPATKDPELPRGVARKYTFVSFRFLPDGSTNLSPTGSWFLTIHNPTKPNDTTLPVNFFTIQVDPVSGSTKGFRPTAG